MIHASWSTLVSPDGAFVAKSAERGTRLPISTSAPAPTLDQQLCGYYTFNHLCDYAPFTPPGAGLAAVDSATTLGYTYSPDSSTTYTKWSSAEIAYRPDGKVLAAILPDAVKQGTATKRITMFDTSNGAQLGTVSALTQPNASFQDDGILSIEWSPSGKQLAYDDYYTNAITLWGGSSLPA